MKNAQNKKPPGKAVEKPSEDWTDQGPPLFLVNGTFQPLGDPTKV
jgi:hypothetical protein